MVSSKQSLKMTGLVIEVPQGLLNSLYGLSVALVVTWKAEGCFGFDSTPPHNCVTMSCCPVSHSATGCWTQCAKNKNLTSAGTASCFSLVHQIDIGGTVIYVLQNSAKSRFTVACFEKMRAEIKSFAWNRSFSCQLVFTFHSLFQLASQRLLYIRLVLIFRLKNTVPSWPYKLDRFTNTLLLWNHGLYTLNLQYSLNRKNKKAILLFSILPFPWGERNTPLLPRQ